MSWWAIEVRGAQSVREQLGALVVRATGQAVEERADGATIGYLHNEADAHALGHRLVAEVDRSITWAVMPVESVDWSVRWRDGLAARRIGRLTIAPTWVALASDPLTVRLDPETAFGTGEHGSTRGALALLDRWLEPGARVLDLGSGSGILAIAAAKLGARSALGIEIDDEAVPIADANAVQNGVADRVRFIAGDAELLGPLAGPAELVVSNILRTINVRLLGPIEAALAPNGVAIFAGMETPEAESFRPELIGRGWSIVDEVVDETWWSVAARRP